MPSQSLLSFTSHPAVSGEPGPITCCPAPRPLQQPGCLVPTPHPRVQLTASPGPAANASPRSPASGSGIQPHVPGPGAAVGYSSPAPPSSGRPHAEHSLKQTTAHHLHAEPSPRPPASQVGPPPPTHPHHPGPFSCATPAPPPPAASHRQLPAWTSNPSAELTRAPHQGPRPPHPPPPPPPSLASPALPPSPPPPHPHRPLPWPAALAVALPPRWGLSSCLS